MAARADKTATMHTSGGRTVSVDRLLLEQAAPIGRVVLRIDCRRAERDHLWTSLTAEEARRLAEYLVIQAASVERCRRQH